MVKKQSFHFLEKVLLHFSKITSALFKWNRKTSVKHVLVFHTKRMEHLQARGFKMLNNTTFFLNYRNWVRSLSADGIQQKC